MSVAQDDPNDVPLGDVARSLRKKSPPQPQVKPVIDDDNLPQVMQQADENRSNASPFKFLMSGETKSFQMAAPDVTCSLSFTANVKSLLAGQYSQMDLPPAELAKVQAQATVEGDSLTVPIFNGTEWHLSELAVAFTIVRKSNEIETDPLEQVRAEKKPDNIVVYKMRAAASPWQPAVFSMRLDTPLAPEDEWHWAIVQAKGYPPEAYATQHQAEAAKSLPAQAVPVSLTDPENPLAVAPQAPHP
ncbi:MAG TPA: hypothetical protein VGS27_18050 [Candidatus Sulfotelmatobacter sp.]|nr:hypothetical protein [Candidatus Sulfotelmatobacter sp.]